MYEPEEEPSFLSRYAVPIGVAANQPSPHAGQPGRYRTIQNYVGNSRTREVIYTPPPPADVAPLMRELVEWLRTDTSIHPVLGAGIAQFQLVHIHPFVDGNGRTSRLLSTLCLYRSGYDFKRCSR